MNERIKELAEQATTIVEMVGPQGYTSSYANFNREKFAELIVAECTKVLFAESERLSKLYSEEDNMGLADHYETCSNQCINDIALIEEHFGL